MRKKLSLYIVIVALYCSKMCAQQVNGVFTPFAKNNEWGNTSINSVRVETNGSITLNGYYEGAQRAGFDAQNNYYSYPHKFPLILRLNSNGTLQSTFGNITGGGSIFTYVNTEAGSSVLDRSYGFTDGFFLLAGHWQTGQGYLTKSNTANARPTAFNGGQILKMPEPSYTRKTYIEDWLVGTGTTFTARMEGVTLTSQKIVVTAYSSVTGTPVTTFGINGTAELPVPGGSFLEDTLPLKMARTNDGTMYVAFTQKITADADDIILYKLNINGIVDSTFGNNVGIGYANFTVPRPFALTSLLLHANGTISMGGYHATGDDSSAVSFRTYDPATQFVTSTVFGAAPGAVAVGPGCKTTGAVLANEVIVFAVAFPYAPNRYRIFIQSHRPGGTGTGLNLTPWQYPGALSAEPTDMVRLSNGSFIVVGKMTRQNGTTAGVVIKYNADGTIDNSFGEQGAFIVNGRAGGAPWADATQLPGNKYLAVGGASFLPEQLEKKAIILNRFNLDGSIDTSFGTNGTKYAYTSDYDRSAKQVYALSNGKFLIGGTYYNYQNEPGIGTGSKGSKATIYKFNEDGSPDNSFGTFNNGRLHFSGYTGLDFKEMKVQNDTIYMAGNTAQSHTGNAKAFIYKLTPNGIPYSSYLPYITFLSTFTISDVTGMAYVGGGTNGSAQLICKVKRGVDATGGRPDSSFGTNGLAAIPIIASGEITEIKQIKLRPGSILVVSEWAASNSAGAVKGLYFTLISQEGIVDANFGTGGNKFLQLPGATSIIAENYKWSSDGNRLVIFGEAIVSGITKGFICKVDLNGDLDGTFGTNGVIWTTATYEGTIVFNRTGDMIAIQNYGLFNGGALAKLEIPADVYDRIKQGSWTGAINNDWFNAGNWAETVVPDAFTEVVIANGSVLIGTGAHAFAYSVRVLGGANLTLGPNSTLDITKNNP